MNKKKILLLILTVLLICGIGVGYHFYNKIVKSNITENHYVYIPTGASFETVQDSLQPKLINISSFVWVAKIKKYHQLIKPGRYELKKGMSNNDIVNLLRIGKQAPIILSFNNQDTFEKLAHRISEQIEADSISLLNAFTDKNFLHENGLNKATALTIYIPNSYEFYWNTSAKGFRNKMLKEAKRFWNTERLNKAKKLNLTKEEVYTLASIVQKETASVSERPTVAGLYLNRYQNGWALQADPTVIYTIKEKYGQNTEIKRVLFKDLSIDSKYNTYVYKGLPPGPIGMPDISSIDAVLTPHKHDYFYMCVDTNNLGKHVFAKTLAQHNRNATKYQQWLNKQGVNR